MNSQRKELTLPAFVSQEVTVLPGTGPALGKRLAYWIADLHSYTASVSHTRKWRFRDIYSLAPGLTVGRE